MGNAAKFVSKNLKPKIKPDTKPQTSAFEGNEMPYNEDVHEIVNLAFAIQKGEFIENMELWFACEKLPKMDTFSLTDPMIVFNQWKEGKDGEEGSWKKIGQTEVIPETLNPKFVKSLLVSYTTDTQKKFKFEVYDIDFFDDIYNFKKQELIGSIECDVREIVFEPTHMIYKPLENPKYKKRKLGTLKITGIEYDVTNSKYEFQFLGKDFAVRGEIFLRFSLINESKETIPFYTTDPEKNVKKGVVEWKPFQIPSTKFNDENTSIKIEAFEFNKSKGTILLGDTEQTLTNLMDNTSKNWIPFVKNGLPIGSLNFKVNKTTKNTFLNYILGGTDVSLIVGIDFSKSNKDPNDPSSLHYLNEDSGENDYILAMRAVIGFLQYYDHDNTIPVYGFGAKLPPYFETVSHCFAINGDFFNPEISGIEQLIKHYKTCVSQIKFHGPSAITDLLKLTCLYASAEVVDDKNQKYFILLIFTDGNLSDMSFTVNEIAKASNLPISIIIVGMGNNDHTKIKDLDNDTYELPSKEPRLKPIRDIVNSVEYSKYKNDIEKLAKETISEIPQQFLEYMNMQKPPIKPMKANQHLTQASHDFMQKKIEERKFNKFLEKEKEIQPRAFLINKKEELIRQLLSQNYEKDLIDEILDKKGLAAFDVNLAGQLISTEKGELKPKIRIMIRPKDLPEEACELIIKNPKVTNKFYKVKNKSSNSKAKKVKKKNENYEGTKKFLEQMEVNDFKGIINDLPECIQNRFQNKLQLDSGIGKDFDSSPKKNCFKKLHKLILNVNQTQLKNYQIEEDLCLICKNEKIDVVFLPCGHAALCHECCEEVPIEDLTCLICKDTVEMISYFKNEFPEEISPMNIQKKKTETLEIQNQNKGNITSFEQIKTYEEIEESLKENIRTNPLISEKEEQKKEDVVLHMEASSLSSIRHSHTHVNTLMMKSLEKKNKMNRERNIMFSDSIGGNVFKDYEKKTESEFSQQEDDIELEYLGI